MKKIIFFIAIIISNQNLLAQQGNDNEIKFNVPMAIYGLPEITYEKIVEDNMSFGASLSIGIDKAYSEITFDGIPERAILCPFYRLYFGQKKAAGFYIEGNMALANQKATLNDYYYDNTTGNYVYTTQTKSTMGFGFGGALGFKLLSKNGFTGDIYGGYGRLFGTNAYYNGYPRIGVCIGKRF